MTNEKKQIYTLRISSANKTELVEILYEMLLDYIEEAKEAIEKDNRVQIRESFRKCRGCLRELMESVDEQNDLCGNLLSIYAYLNKELIISEIKKDNEKLENVRNIIVPFKETYEEVAKTDESEAIMSNTQKVVAGYTYSRNNINETLADQNNRGFYV